MGYEYVIRMNMICAISFEHNGKQCKMRLPTKYIGEGNDIAAAVLDVMYIRFIADSNKETAEYDQCINKQPWAGPRTYLSELMWREEYDGTDDEDWSTFEPNKN